MFGVKILVPSLVNIYCWICPIFYELSFSFYENSHCGCALHVYICQKYIFPFLQYLLINNLFAIQSVRCLTFIGFFHSAGIVVWVLTSFYFYWKWYAKLSHQSFDGTFLPKNMLSWPSTRIPPIEWFLKGYRIAMHSVATKRAHAYMVEIPMPYSFCKTLISMRWP